MASKRRCGGGLRDYRYRAFVGPADKYDLLGAIQFNLLTFLDLREHHFLLDVGCGSLTGGRLFIPYLLPGRYYGIEPLRWLIEEGIRHELGEDMIRVKQPVFSNDDQFTLSTFKRRFDFILAHSIFSHASQRQIRRCLSEAKKVMKPTSIFAATFAKGKQDYTGDEWVYPGFVTYTLEHMRILVEDSGLVCRPIDWPHPDFQTWMVIANPENEENIQGLSGVTKLSRLENELKIHKERLSHARSQVYNLFDESLSLAFCRRNNITKR